MRIVVVGPGSLLAEAFIQKAKLDGHELISIGRKPGNKVTSLFYPCSFKSPTELTNCINQIQSDHGNIDVAVNFIGMHHKPMDFLNDDPEELYQKFQEVIHVNVNLAFMVTMCFGQHMMKVKNGHIIHLCSNASRLSLYGSYGYNASKHGLEGIIKTAAAQFAPYHVRVNGVAPGTTISDLNRAMLIKDEQLTPRALTILAHTPTKQFCDPDGVAETIMATCVPQRHLTGNVIFCDDGYNIEGHSWPDGNVKLYENKRELDNNNE
jgi:NAD(P)-dependent dehydrogenase (short-subunit alcohol dehydrogenase family)